MSSTSGFDKKAFLKALEEDKELRYTVMGLLGFKEILDRITRVEERQQKLEERFARLEERQQKLEERFARLEERFARVEEKFARLEERQQKLEERFARLEERFARIEEKFAKLEERQLRLEEKFAKLEERQQRLEEKFARIEERQQRLEERQQRLEEEMQETRRVLAVIAHRFGVLSETEFREAMKYVVEEALGAGRVEKWVYEDKEGIVYGYPSIIEVDVLVRDAKHIIVEVKSRVSKGDVAELYRKGLLYERVTKVKPELVIIGGFIDSNAYEAAGRLGVRIRPALKETLII